MADPDKLQKAITRRAQAESLMRNELLIEAFDKLEAEYFAGWKSSKLSEERAREKLWLAANIIGQVRSHLSKVIEDGRLAQAELDAMIKSDERRKVFGLI